MPLNLDQYFQWSGLPTVFLFFNVFFFSILFFLLVSISSDLIFFYSVYREFLFFICLFLLIFLYVACLLDGFGSIIFDAAISTISIFWIAISTMEVVVWINCLIGCGYSDVWVGGGVVFIWVWFVFGFDSFHVVRFLIFGSFSWFLINNVCPESWYCIFLHSKKIYI